MMELVRKAEQKTVSGSLTGPASLHRREHFAARLYYLALEQRERLNAHFGSEVGPQRHFRVREDSAAR
jgi:hypothetical protein